MNILSKVLPDRAGWGVPSEMLSVLNGIEKDGIQLRFPFGKIVDLDNGSLFSFSQSEEKCFELNTEDSTLMFSPEVLRFESFYIGDQKQYYFWIDLNNLPITPNFTDSYSWPVVERLTEVAPKVYLQPHYWNSKKLPNGESLPDCSRFVYRCREGSILIAPNSFIFDFGTESYLDGGEHFRMVVDNYLSRL